MAARRARKPAYRDEPDTSAFENFPRLAPIGHNGGPDLGEQIALADCRQSFEAFVSRIDIPGTPSLYRHESERFTAPARVLPRHHVEACRLLQLAAEGEVRRFMIFWPPGTAKSTLTSQLLPAWSMGRDPYMRFILTSYGTQLARKHSRRAREIARTPGFRRIFDTGISKLTGAANEWSLLNGAEMIAAGLDAGVTGNRAKLALFDDPFKGRKQASSPLIRVRTREAIEDDLKTRLIEDISQSPPVFGSMGGIFTRWIDDDPAAWFLGDDYNGESGWIKGTDGLQWFVLNCPAECERDDDPLGRKIGEYIWPERFSRDYWQPFKRVARTWSSLYQQRPAPPGGTIFKRHWFEGKIVAHTDIPKLMTRVRGWDFAASEDDGSEEMAYSAAVKMARSDQFKEPRFFVGPVWRGRESAGSIDVKLGTITRKDGPGVIVDMPQDPAQAGKDQREKRVRIAKQAGAHDVRYSPESGSKIYRADAYAAECEKGNVYLISYPKDHPDYWDIDAYLDELCAFPVGKTKDQVDASTRACNALLGKGSLRTVSTGF